MDCSMPGLTVHYQLPEFTQTHVHWVSDINPIISSSVVPLSSRLQSFPTSGPFQMSQFFASGSQSIEVSASTSVLPMNTQDWSPLGWTGWISILTHTHEVWICDGGASLMVQRIKHLLAMQETQLWSLGQKNPLEKEMATHSSTVTWKIPWTEEPGGLPFIVSQRVGHDGATPFLSEGPGCWVKGGACAVRHFLPTRSPKSTRALSLQHPAPTLRHPGTLGLCGESRPSPQSIFLAVTFFHSWHGEGNVLGARKINPGLWESGLPGVSQQRRTLTYASLDSKTEELSWGKVSGKQASLFWGGLDLGSVFSQKPQLTGQPLPPLPRSPWATGWILACWTLQSSK